MSAAAMPKSRLYRTARRRAAAPATEFDDLGRGVSDAVDAIVAGILRTVDAKVTAAATVGATQLDILRFHGNDLDDTSGFPMLTLVKGPRDADLRAVSGPTLIEALRDALAPFEVVHTWHTRSNMNRIILKWQHELILPAAGDDGDDGDETDDSGETAAETEDEEEEDTGDARSLLQALQKQLREVESAAAASDSEGLQRRHPRTLPEIPEESADDPPGKDLEELQARLQSLLLQALR